MELFTIIHGLFNRTEEYVDWRGSSTPIRYEFFKNICVITVVDSINQRIVLPWLCVVAFMDSVVCMMDALLMNLYEFTTFTYRVQQIFTAVIDSYIRKGDRTYDVLKSYHAVSVGALLNIVDAEYRNDLYDETLSDSQMSLLSTSSLRFPILKKMPAERPHLQSFAEVFIYPVICINTAVDTVM